MEKGMGLSFLRAIYVLTSIVLFVYGFNAFVLIFQYLKHRRERVICPPLGCFPVITVQLPLYNERYVAKRAIDTLVRLDWPRDRLQIQVVDDSTDETRFIVRQCVEKYRHQGVDITHLHRPRRVGFKAGALNEAMQHARGDFVAIFDADFCPPPDLLRRMVPHLVADSSLGFVQVRWGHLNDAFSLVTMAQAIALDGHFAIEHVARERAGWLTNFSGTGGMWRRACIEECGGWDNEILTEDMDLSFRAQLAGWKGLTLCDVSVPGELPVQVAAFEQQQFRWAKGNTHCLLKHRKNIWHAPLPLFARIQAFIHLGNYLAQPLMLIAMLITLPLLAHGLLGGGPLALLSLATLGPPSLYILGQWSLYADWPRRLAAVPVLPGYWNGAQQHGRCCRSDVGCQKRVSADTQVPHRGTIGTLAGLLLCLVFWTPDLGSGRVDALCAAHGICRFGKGQPAKCSFFALVCRGVRFHQHNRFGAGL
jgi:cellulose synthase/poly-beta-1,6-N-acetylglucosamine synthase-like glycosyltransferase